MKILLFSDIHLTTPSTRTTGAAHPFIDAITHANMNHSDAEFAIFLGDLTQDGTTSEYKALSEVIAQLKVPSHLMLGNHDIRSNFVTVFGEEYLNTKGYVQTVVDSPNLQFLLLDSHSTDITKGELDKKRLEWLEEQLQIAEHPCCICLHHQPVNTGLPAYDQIGLHCPDFMNLMVNYRSKIHMILHGHCHMAFSGSLSGIPLVAIKSLCHQAVPNFHDKNFITSEHQETSYSIFLTNGENSFVHTIAL